MAIIQNGSSLLMVMLVLVLLRFVDILLKMIGWMPSCSCLIMHFIIQALRHTFGL